MTVDEVMVQLEKYSHPPSKKTYLRHGAKEPVFGVKISDLKVIQKKVKKDHALSLALYETGNSDAMYLAGLISDPEKMTKAQLQKWLKQAYWYMLSDFTVPWVAAESRFGLELGLEWIDSPKELVASAGWFTLSSIVGITPDEELDLDLVTELLDRVDDKIELAKNRVRYAMNGFVISVGTYVEPLLAKAKATAKSIGTVHVDHGNTSCKTPNALEYIEYVAKAGRVGKKRKTAMC